VIKTLKIKPQSLPLSLDFQAREAFFAHYVKGDSRCWDFLEYYYHPNDCPDHLLLAIEAVSLAYLWHQVYSETALAVARERYSLALRMINRALKSPKEATKDKTLLASLLLDLFEKITDNRPKNNPSWRSHLNGALALVRLRGKDKFHGDFESRILQRIIQYYIASCLASVSPVSEELIAIRDYDGRRDTSSRPLDLMVQFANLYSNTQRGLLSYDESIVAITELDGKLQVLDYNLLPSWQYSTTFLDCKSERVLELHWDSYPHRNICQAWNFLRLMRILLNERLIEYYSASHSFGDQIEFASENIRLLAREICACVPQYVDCDGAARQRLAAPGAGHSHTPDNHADCYTLIFPLYAAGRYADPQVRCWVIKQLHYIGSHFYMRRAEMVAEILEHETDIGLWEVFAMLGSYAFTA
jgi:hypothetical protein